MSVADYLDAQQSNLGQLKRLPHYIRLLEPIDALYRQATDLLPPTSRRLFQRAAVGDEIAVCGYAHGSILLRRGKTIDRFGPLLLPGWISALSPFDVPRPGLLLLSLVAARRASGSPVFQRDTGLVIGVLVEGQEGKGTIVSMARALFDNKGQILARIGRPQVVASGPAGTEGKGSCMGTKC